MPRIYGDKNGLKWWGKIAAKISPSLDFYLISSGAKSERSEDECSDQYFFMTVRFFSKN